MIDLAVGSERMEAHALYLHIDARVIHDGINGKKKTAIKSLVRTEDSPIVTAIADFAGSTVAKAWVERNARGSK